MPPRAEWPLGPPIPPVALCRPQVPPTCPRAPWGPPVLAVTPGAWCPAVQASPPHGLRGHPCVTHGRRPSRVDVGFGLRRPLSRTLTAACRGPRPAALLVRRPHQGPWEGRLGPREELGCTCRACSRGVREVRAAACGGPGPAALCTWRSLRRRAGSHPPRARGPLASCLARWQVGVGALGLRGSRVHLCGLVGVAAGGPRTSHTHVWEGPPWAWLRQARPCVVQACASVSPREQLGALEGPRMLRPLPGPRGVVQAQRVRAARRAPRPGAPSGRPGHCAPFTVSTSVGPSP